MTRKDFESVRLTKDQKQTLAQMVDAKYSMIAQIDSKIANSIPSSRVKKLQKAFREAKREGNNEIEAMGISMKQIGLPEDVQESVLEMNQSKESIMEAIKTSVVQTFDQEQQNKFAAAMAAKKEMSAKEQMSDKEMSDKEMAGDKETDGEQEMMDKKMANSGSASK